MIDTERIKQEINLLELIPGDFKRVAGTGGGEFAGPCPFCGGRDRLRIQPDYSGGGRWFCRGCHDKWSDAIDFVMLRDHVEFREAAAVLGGEDQGGSFVRPDEPGRDTWEYWEREAAKITQNPDGWEAAAIQAIGESCGELWTHPAILRYLRERRGLADETIQAAGLGYNPEARNVGGYWLEAGIVIPHLAGDRFTCVNVRTTKDRQQQGRPKYQAMAGSVKTRLYNQNTLDGAETAVICESEFDCLLLAQSLPEKWAAVATGGAHNRLRPKYGALPLARAWRVILAFDNDLAGDQAREDWRKIRPDSHIFPLPDGYKDITEFWANGGDLAAIVEQCNEF